MQLGFEVVGAKTKKETGAEKPVQEPMRPAKGARNPSTDQLKARRQLAKSAGLSPSQALVGQTVECASCGAKHTDTTGWGKLSRCPKCTADGTQTFEHFEKTNPKAASRSDYAHHGEDANAIWYQEEGRFGSEPEDDPNNGDADFYDDYAHDEDDDDDDGSYTYADESRDDDRRHHGGIMNREAQLISALAKATPAEQMKIAAEMEMIRGARRANALGVRESTIGGSMAAIHLTPVHGHVHHTSSTDWLGEADALPADREIHMKAGAEAAVWSRRVHAMVREDCEEYLTQAQGYARVWAGQFGVEAASAEQSFLAMAAHLAGFRTTAGNPHAVGTPAWFDWEYDDDAEGKGPFDSGAPGGGIPLHGPLSDEQQAWMDKGRKKSTRRVRADQGMGPSDESQSGFAETGLDAVDVAEASQDFNLGWIGGTDADETTFEGQGDINTQKATASVPAYMRQAMRLFASDGATCADCGASIERDPEGESNRSWHHNDGSSHDHEAKPSSSKESRRVLGNGGLWYVEEKRKGTNDYSSPRASWQVVPGMVFENEADANAAVQDGQRVVQHSIFGSKRATSDSQDAPPWVKDDGDADDAPDDQDAPPDDDSDDDDADSKSEMKKDARRTAMRTIADGTPGSGDDEYDPEGPGSEDGMKPAGAAPMVQPGDEGDVAMFEPEFPEPENTAADRTASRKVVGASDMAQSRASRTGLKIQRDWMGGSEVIDLDSDSGLAYFINDVTQDEEAAQDEIARIKRDGFSVVNEGSQYEERYTVLSSRKMPPFVREAYGREGEVYDAEGRLDSFKCARCGARVLMNGHGQDTDCERCGTWYNASGQMLRDDWSGNESNWNDDMGDMEGFEQQQVRLDSQGSLEYPGGMTTIAAETVTLRNGREVTRYEGDLTARARYIINFLEHSGDDVNRDDQTAELVELLDKKGLDWVFGPGDNIVVFEKTGSKKTAMPAPGDVGVSVGDFFVHSWGYDQTNVDFYQVVGLTPAGVRVRHVKNKLDHSSSTDDYMVPQVDGFDGPPVVKKVKTTGQSGMPGDQTDNRVYLTQDYGWCQKWDGQPKRQTGSGYGH